MRVVPIKPLSVKCMSRYFQERKGKMLQILLWYVTIFSGKEWKNIANIVINTQVCVQIFSGKERHCKYCFQYFQEVKGNILQILLLILANIKCMPQYF